MKYLVFGKTINISDEYEEKWKLCKKTPLNTARIEALARTSGCAENSSCEDILQGIYEGIDDYCAVCNNLPNMKKEVQKRARL